MSLVGNCFDLGREEGAYVFVPFLLEKSRRWPKNRELRVSQGRERRKEIGEERKMCGAKAES